MVTIKMRPHSEWKRSTWLVRTLNNASIPCKILIFSACNCSPWRGWRVLNFQSINFVFFLHPGAPHIISSNAKCQCVGALPCHPDISTPLFSYLKSWLLVYRDFFWGERVFVLLSGINAALNLFWVSCEGSLTFLNEKKDPCLYGELVRCVRANCDELSELSVFFFVFFLFLCSDWPCT